MAAETKARALVIDYGWVVEEIAIASEMLPEQLLGLDEVQTAHYRKALRHGISAAFHAWPREAGPEVVELRSMGPPVGDGTKQ